MHFKYMYVIDNLITQDIISRGVKIILTILRKIPLVVPAIKIMNNSESICGGCLDLRESF